MDAFVWHTPLCIEAFSLSEITRRQQLWDTDRPNAIPKKADRTAPWCRLIEPLRGYSTRCGEFEIPAGFVYDQATILWAARQWMGPSDPRIARAACWHDWLSPWPGAMPPEWTHEGQTFRLNKTGAAEELFDGMRADGANWFDAALVSRTVKTFQGGWET